MSSPVKICLNELCGTTTTSQWKRGWPMKVGGVATLCYVCGTEYDNVRYCERFHLNESGWRECAYCDKPVHCGCVVSQYLHECLDSGGISCINCIKAQPLKQAINENPNSFSWSAGNWLPSVFTNQTNNITPLTKELEKHQFTSSNISKQFGTRCTSGNDTGPSFKSPLSSSTIFSNQSPLSTEPNNNNHIFGSNSNYEPRVQQFNGLAIENVSLVKNEQKQNQMAMKQLKSGVSIRSKSNLGPGSGLDNRVGRPPGEGRIRCQLLPRYWPKITNEELMQINGDLNSNCTITPLFEKILSASDAGRIGRLVLPKACAEMYFPPIDHSEGVPVKVRDIKGKEWTFQFRFWPNNNSRMYVLEGVTSCIQNMQLQAGDTVIFSRIDPEDKLLIGYRKATVPAEFSTPNPNNNGSLISTENQNLPTNVEHEGTSNCDSLQQSVIQVKKNARNIGSKSKRLHMHCEDALQLKLTYEQAQEYLRPPHSKPTVIVIENCEFEEYDEPPVFGKKTIFTTNVAQLQEQWVQCDSCSKWRNLPSNVLVLSKWTCSDNVSDPNRCSCSVPEDKEVKHLNRFLKLSKESKKQKVDKNCETKQVGPIDLDALATLAVSKESDTENGSLSGPTTRHPRHRPGCSCIVCIQPPSGKGNHKPNCVCNVCLTVRRRFKTLMLRKKKRLAEQEGKMVQKSRAPDTNQTGSVNGLGHGPESVIESSDNINKGQDLDLNCDPIEGQMMVDGSVGSFSINPVWQNVLERLVPNGTSDTKGEYVLTNKS